MLISDHLVARSTDITVCPDKLDWGLSYDDGPSPYTPLLLDYREFESEIIRKTHGADDLASCRSQSTPTT